MALHDVAVFLTLATLVLQLSLTSMQWKRERLRYARKPAKRRKPSPCRTPRAAR